MTDSGQATDARLAEWLAATHPNPVGIFFAHPDIERSRVNRVLRDSIKDLPHVYVNDLYETYPNLLVNVRREQTIARHARLLVFHHPFYWYSSPAMIKQWFDMVLERGWAYGEGGHALKGRDMMIVTTTGGPEEAYAPGGYNRFTMAELLRPQDQTAHLCGMRFVPPMIVHRSRTADQATITKASAAYRALLERYAVEGPGMFGASEVRTPG